MIVSTRPEAQVQGAVDSLRSLLGRNLHSCILSGSAVRGDLVPGVSDVNLLLVLEASTPAAHDAIRGALEPFPLVNPVVVGRRDLPRTFRAFATKFRSIQRSHRVLCGADVLEGLTIDPAAERFLVEQALRNHSLRLTNLVVTHRGTRRRFTRVLLRHRTGILTQLSEALRLSGVELPADRQARLPIIEREMNLDASVLQDLATLKQERRKLKTSEWNSVYARLLAVVTAALNWIEQRWPIP